MKRYPNVIRKSWIEHFLFIIPLTLNFLFVNSQETHAQCNPQINLNGAGVPLCETNNTDFNLAITGTNLGGSSGSWSGWSGAAAGSATAAMFNPSVEGPNMYILTWTVDVPDGDCMVGETAIDTVYVDGDNASSMPFLFADFQLNCVGDQPAISTIPTSATFAPATYNFSIDGGNTSASGATVSSLGVVDVTGAGMVSVDVTESNECDVSLPANLLLEFNEDPDLSVNMNSVTLCANDVSTGIVMSSTYTPTNEVEYLLIDMTSNNALGLMINDILGPGANVAVPMPVLSNPFMDGSISYTFVARLNDGSDCTSNQIVIDINLEALPDFVPSAQAVAICSGDPIDVTLLTNYTVPSDVEFWLTDYLGFFAPNVSGNTLIPGPISGTGSVFSSGDVLSDVLTNTGPISENVIFQFTPVRTDGLMCVGYPIEIAVVVQPEINLEITANQNDYCSGENLDFTISTTTGGGGVSFSLVIDQAMDASYPADLGDDNNFPIIIPGLVATVGGNLNTTSLATQINNAIGTFDRGRVILGFEDIHLLDDTTCVMPDIIPAPGSNTEAVIYPVPVLQIDNDYQMICSGTNTALDLKLENFNSLDPSLAGFPVEIEWTVVTSNFVGGITGVSNGSGVLFDVNGIETVGFDIDQTLHNMAFIAELATYFVTPKSPGPNGVLGDADDCIGEQLIVQIVVNPVPALSPVPPSQTICSGSSFSIEMTTLNIPTPDDQIYEYLVTNISSNPNLNAGNSIVPNSTVFHTGEFMTEQLTSTTNSPETVTYTLRPQEINSRVDPLDPATATCFGSNVNIEITVSPAVSATINVTGDTQICIGESLELEGVPQNMAGVVTHFWEILDPQPTGFTGKGNIDGDLSSTDQTINFEADSAGMIRLRYTPQDTGICGGLPAEIDIEILELPTVGLTLPALVCIDGLPELLIGTPTDANGVFSTNASLGLADNGDGTASFDGTASGAGIFDITYTYTESTTGCTDSLTENIEALICTPEISILDPCTCRESSPGSQGNATTLENGQFVDTVQIVAPSGQTWYIAEANGFFDIASPLPPSLPNSYTTGPAGDTLVENPAGSGVYQLPGVFVDGIMYSISVTNGVDTLSISNTCYYPNPVMDTVNGGFCTNGNPVPLSGNADPAAGIGVFDILNEDGTFVVQANVTELDPASLNVGTYQIRYTFDEEPNIGPCVDCNPGCVQAIYKEVKIVPPPNTITCNNLINISLNQSCTATVDPDMVLEGDFPSYDIFIVELFHNNVNIGNTITAAQVGETLNVKVTDTCTGNSCWSLMNVEDKLPPVFACPDTLVVFCTANLDLIAPPIATDNCEGNIIPTLVGEQVTNFDCSHPDSIIRRVTRIWRAQDSQGNVASNCKQIIDLKRGSLDDIVFPLNYDNVQLPALDCDAQNTEPEFTGYPTLNGEPLDGGDYCTLTATHDDQIIEACGGTTKILRNWLVFDWCSPTAIGVNPSSHTQVIKLMDTIPPIITLTVDTLIVGATSFDCTGMALLPTLDIEDNCSDFTVTIFTPTGSLVSNGGLFPDLDFGNHEMVYVAEDDCGNTASDTIIVSVIDNVPPVAVCDEFTVAAIASNGQTTVFAASFDDGSFDNCTPVSFAVKRMDDPGPFGPTVTFDCFDVGQSINVIFQVSDLFDNTNSCMVVVDVQNDIGPVISCPNDITIECTEDPFDLSLTGNATGIGNCAIVMQTFEDILDTLNQCGERMILREFTVADINGIPSSCVQTIMTINNNPFDSTNVFFPEDFTTTDCTSFESLHPDSLPSSPINFSWPTFDDEACSLIATSPPIDEILPVIAPACFKIVRKWIVIDWCQYNPDISLTVGRFEEIQVITVMDNLPPTLIAMDHFDVGITDNNCVATVILPDPFVDDCSQNITVTASGDLGVGLGPFTNVPPGNYTMTYTANDGCNNTISSVITINVFDNKPPTVFCNDLIVENMPPIGMVGVPAAILDAGSSDNCTPDAELQFSFSSNVLDTVMNFDCDNLGVNLVEVWVTDTTGNQDFCVTEVTIQDNMNNCMDSLVVISGGISTIDNESVNNVMVDVNGNPTMITDANGTYTFSNLIQGGDYTITPAKDDDLLNGVTTYDLTLISKHILNIEPLDSPYKLIAADINNTGTITTLDIVYLRKSILMVNDFFPNNTSWRFIDAEHEFLDPTNPFLEPIPEVLNFNNLSSNELAANFIGVKIGDLNGSADPANLDDSEERSNEAPFVINVEVKPDGDDIIFEFYGKSMKQILGFQFGLKFNDLDMEFVGLEEQGLVSAGHLGFAMLNEGLITASWNTAGYDEFTNAGIENNAFLFALRFEKIGEIDNDNLLSINSQSMKSEAYHVFSEGFFNSSREFLKTDVELELNNRFEMENGAQFTLYQNYPNPFQEKTIIPFHLPQNDFVTLKIVDISGKILMQTTRNANAGIGEFQISREDLSASGVLYYQLETSFGTATKKMIVIE